MNITNSTFSFSIDNLRESNLPLILPSVTSTPDQEAWVQECLHRLLLKELERASLASYVHPNLGTGVRKGLLQMRSLSYDELLRALALAYALCDTSSRPEVGRLRSEMV